MPASLTGTQLSVVHALHHQGGLGPAQEPLDVAETGAEADAAHADATPWQQQQQEEEESTDQGADDCQQGAARDSVAAPG